MWSDNTESPVINLHRLHRGRGIAAERWTEKVLGEPANGAELFPNKQPYRVLKTAVGKRTPVFLKELE